MNNGQRPLFIIHYRSLLPILCFRYLFSVSVTYPRFLLPILGLRYLSSVSVTHERLPFSCFSYSSSVSMAGAAWVYFLILFRTVAKSLGNSDVNNIFSPVVG